MPVEPKMERKEISTTAAGFDFAIEFRWPQPDIDTDRPPLTLNGAGIGINS